MPADAMRLARGLRRGLAGLCAFCVCGASAAGGGRSEARAGKQPEFEWLNVFDLMGGEDRRHARYLIGNVDGLLVDGLKV